MQKIMLVGFLIGSYWSFFGSVEAQAETEVEAQGNQVQEQIVYKKTTIIDFSDVTITGELTKPEGSYLMNRKKAQFDLLIIPRNDFLPEIIQTVDNL